MRLRDLFGGRRGDLRGSDKVELQVKLDAFAIFSGVGGVICRAVASVQLPKGVPRS